MSYCSRSVSGQQEAIHPNLVSTVEKHLASSFNRPIQPYNIEAIDWLLDQWQQCGKPSIVLDSGCGVGESTKNLAAQLSDHLVIGIDQSQHRLNKHGADTGLFAKDNYRLLRADLIDCWRLLNQHQLLPEYHFIPYPNPWPKKKHLIRRWHGHPVFKDILSLGGKLQVRSNWKTYIDEFGIALETAGYTHTGTESFAPEEFLTPFEKKYFLSGQALFRINADLSKKP